MTVLYSNDFEAETDGQPLPGWTSVGGPFRVRTAGPVRGTKALSADTNGELAYWEGAFPGSQTVRIAQSFLTTGALMGITLRRWYTNAQYYIFRYGWNGTHLRAQISKNDFGAAGDWYSAYDIPCTTAGTVIHMEASAVGSTLSMRIWTGSNPRPASPTLTTSDSAWASGYPGLIRLGGGFEFAAADDLVITDAAGGEDFFYPPPATPTLTGSVTLDNMAPTGSMSTAPLSSLAGSVLLDEMLASGTLGLQPGLIASEPFKNWSGTLQAGVTIPKVAVVRISDMVTVLNLTNQTTNGSGVLSITSSTMTPGVRYLLVTCDAAGTAFGAEPYTAVGG